MDNTHNNFGVMDFKDNWDIEDAIFKRAKLKEDSDNYWEINEAGYEEFYLENREKFKKVNIINLINKELAKRLKSIQDHDNFMHREGYSEFRVSENYEINKFNIYVVVGFMYLKYQVDIPEKLKEEILNIVNKSIFVKKMYLDTEDGDATIHLLHFKECIEKEDGEGLTNIDVILPKRTIYE